VIIIGAALMMVGSKNLVHSALWLVLVFIGVSGVYMLLEADFLAVVQLLVYAGAIAVLLVFGVMLTRRGDMSESNPFNKYAVSGAVVALLFFLLVESMVNKTDWPVRAYEALGSGTAGPIAEGLLGQFVVPFEVAAILLLVAMVGAIILARGVREDK